MISKLVVSLFYFYFVCCYTIHPAQAIVHLKSLPTSSFVETPARFGAGAGAGAGAGFNGSEICGAVHMAHPLDACSPLLNKINDDTLIKFALIVRGNCTFHHKILNAQLAGFHAAIVFDHQLHRSNLISMIGRSEGIWARAIFVSNADGEILKKHARGEDGECCIITSLGEATWNVLMISFISLLVIATVLATLLWTRIYWRNRKRSSRLVGENLVELLPCLTFSAAQISGYMGESCAICLESYQDGESLKLLACQHKFHADCVSSWLTNWNTCCPVCKYDLKSELHN